MVLCFYKIDFATVWFLILQGAWFFASPPICIFSSGFLILLHWHSYANNISKNISPAVIYNKFTWCLATVKVVIFNEKIFFIFIPIDVNTNVVFEFKHTNAFMSIRYWIPHMFNQCLYSWYFKTLDGFFLCSTRCNNARMDHRKYFSSFFWILRHSYFTLSSFGNGKQLEALMGLCFTSPET